MIVTKINDKGRNFRGPGFFFVHVPRVGGTTLSFLLRKSNMTVCHYDGVIPPKKVGKFELVFGHIPQNAYKDRVKLTWLRDPVERVISHYYLMLEKKYKVVIYPTNKGTLVRYNKGMSLLDFATQTANLQSRYLSSPEDLAFVGIHELFRDSLSQMERILGVSLKYSQQKLRSANKKVVSDEVKETIRKINSKDQELYNRFLAERRGWE